MHHELPDLLVPYKRHCSATVENIVAGATTAVYCEAGTMKKIATWFRERSRYFFGCIERVLGCNGFAGNVSSVSLLQRIKVAVGATTSWLKRLVRIVVNSNFWIHTRSEYLPVFEDAKLIPTSQEEGRTGYESE